MADGANLSCSELSRYYCWQLAGDFATYHSIVSVQVIWKGTNTAPFSKGMDIIARHHMEEMGLPFLDTDAIISHFKEDIAAGCCSDLNNRGFHIGAIAHNIDSTKRITVSSMVTQALLGMICKSQKVGRDLHECGVAMGNPC
jgi:hypothetical protein